MKIIVGLGNPGPKYENTRHNAGFLALDILAEKLNTKIQTQKFKALIGEVHHNGQKVILVKPQTYMNLSGESVREIMDYYDAYIEDLLVISDDKDMDIGKIRIRPKGSSGGQNGLNNIIHHLQTQEIARLKIGIGKNPLIKTADYVLGKMDSDTALDAAAAAAYDFASGMDLTELMNKHNSRTL